MKNFNWEDFKNGKIAVHCDTKEKARYFLKKCKEKGFIWNDESDISPNDYSWASYKEETTYSMGEKGIMFGDIDVYENENLKIIKWGIDTMKELIFKEVIANIKEGEVWEGEYEKIIGLKFDRFKIEWKFGDKDIINPRCRYKLQRKEYSFAEAFKAYEEGKEIESVESEHKYRKEDGEELCRYLADWEENETGFCIEEIRGAWYING